MTSPRTAIEGRNVENTREGDYSHFIKTLDRALSPGSAKLICVKATFAQWRAKEIRMSKAVKEIHILLLAHTELLDVFNAVMGIEHLVNSKTSRLPNSDSKSRWEENSPYTGFTTSSSQVNIRNDSRWEVHQRPLSQTDRSTVECVLTDAKSDLQANGIKLEIIEDLDLELPASLRRYLRRTFSSSEAVEDVSLGETEKRLEQLIDEVIQKDLVLRVSWDTLPLPQELVKQERERSRCGH